MRDPSPEALRTQRGRAGRADVPAHGHGARHRTPAEDSQASDEEDEADAALTATHRLARSEDESEGE